ncbi:unnamed protein product [Phaedon cochleariae]|uniref:Peptidase S1 domain-containing protein n=1 Tax=Phaedon cochleariae TaxID=80249 RepID=A0A9N9WY15_PHACE|nr:unnamed protein product [Phaedon cochleariae]
MCQFSAKPKLRDSILVCFFIGLLTANTSPDIENSFNPRIVGGSKCEQVHPHFVALHRPFGHHYCGGSLVSMFWVLTAAHCDKPNQYALMGFSTGELNSMSFWTESMRNDISLMRLASPAYENDFIRYVTLPPHNNATEDDVCPQSVLVMGMGRTKNGFSEGDMSTTLNCVQLPPISLRDCSGYYPGSDMVNVLCTNTLGMDACQGDSGGPLMCEGAQYGVTDYSRHLDEIAKMAERTTLEAVQRLLICGKTLEAVDLIARWEAYRDVKDSANLTMEEELKLFLRKIGKVEEIVEALKAYVSTEPDTVLRKLEEKLNVVAQAVKKEGSLNAGGKFEWVDSILVKIISPQKQTVTIKYHIPFSAVLDRLNALLEPNGVLTISERGVDDTGRMIEIKPHKDFRMFFTMDPKNGEISRAMRNRGIELYILSENETKTSNEFDRLGLINLEGMQNTMEIVSLNRIHASISDLTLGEKPTVKELLQAASLIAQQINMDKSTLEVFTDVVIEVYYKTRSAFEFDSDDPVAVIKNEVKQQLCTVHELDHMPIEVNDLYDDSITLKTSNIGVASMIEKIKQQSVLLLKYLGKDVNFELLHRFVNYYSISSIEDLDMRHCYIESKLEDPSFHKFVEDLYNITSSVKNPGCKYLPLDNNWTPDTFHLEIDTLQSNKLNLALFLTSFYFLERHEREETKKKNRKTKSVSLLDYMHERECNKIEDKFNDAVIDNYIKLIEEFDKFVVKVTSNLHTLSNNDTIRLCYLASWRFLLHKCTLTNIKSLTPAKQYDILVKLSAHYKWFNKFSVNQFSSIVQIDLPAELTTVLGTINSKLEGHFALMQKLGSHYQKHSNRPYINSAPLEVISAYNSIKHCYDLCQKGSDVVKILRIFKQETKLKALLVEVKSKLDYSACELSQELRDLHLKCSGMEVQLELGEFDLKVSPLLDVFTQLQVRTGILRVDPSVLANDILVPPEFSGALMLYHEHQNPLLLPEIMRSYYTYLMYSASTRPGRYLKRDGDRDDLVLSCFSPRLAFYFSCLLVDDRGLGNSASVTLGNFRELTRVHGELSGILWGNVYQLSETKYDNLYTEKRQIIKIYETLIEELFHSMKINFPKHQPLQTLTITLTDALRQWKHASTLSDPQEELEKFIKRLQKSSLNLTKLQNCSTLNESLLIISDLYMDLGYVKATLNSKLTPIDPLVKRVSKRNYCDDSIAMFGDMKKCYEEQNAIYSNNDSTRHAYCESIGKLLEELTVVNYAFSTILSDDHVTKITSTLNSHILNVLEALSDQRDIDLGHHAAALSRHESMVSSYENLIHEWNTFWGSFPDVVEPLIGNITEFLYGLKMKIFLLKKCLAEYEFTKLGVDVNRQLVNFVKLPVLDGNQSSYESYLSIFADKNFNNFVNHVLEDDEHPYVKNEESFRLLKLGIQESFNYCVIDAKSANVLTKNTFLEFNNIINVFVHAYNKHQEEKETREKEEGSLYKIKTKCDDKTEDEQSEEELKELFPNYHGIDFSDFQNNAVLSDEVDESNLTLKHKDVISPSDLKELVHLHVALMNSFTKTEWLNPSKDKTIHHDFIQPVMEKFRTFAKILAKSVHSLDYTIDNRILGSLSVLLAVTKSHGESSNLCDQPTSPTRMINKTAGDFYKDSNVEEIILVIDRISSFDINSPISRFLTGFEILLTKCHEWEQVAHSGVSLSQHYQNITEQIITWRKLELTMWKDLLNRTYERQFIVEKLFTVQELIETLQNFLSKSNLAEFHGRLDLIRVFHCHATYLERTKESEEFINVLWNLQSYFQQFGTTVSNKIKDLRSPIEKKLKEYVKIVRWKDINYWAITDTVDKSHKTLHKYMREFQDVLLQPVSSCLHNTNVNTANENVGIWDRPQRQVPKTYHYTLDPEAYMAKHSLVKKIQLSETEENQGLLSKTESYFLKSRKLCKDTILATKYPSLVQSLDSFVSTIIETSSHLQNLEVDKNIPKEKQKGQAKSILQQKHRALADLFKTLSKIGLSFRTGIIESKLKNPASDFVLKPIDLSANFSFINHG